MSVCKVDLQILFKSLSTHLIHGIQPSNLIDGNSSEGRAENAAGPRTPRLLHSSTDVPSLSVSYPQHVSNIHPNINSLDQPDVNSVRGSQVDSALLISASGSSQIKYSRQLSHMGKITKGYVNPSCISLHQDDCIKTVIIVDYVFLTISLCQKQHTLQMLSSYEHSLLGMVDSLRRDSARRW